MSSLLSTYRQAVQQAVGRLHAAGIPAFQGVEGYVAAIYPDGTIRRVKPLAVIGQVNRVQTGIGDAANSDDTRWTERGGEVHSRFA